MLHYKISHSNLHLVEWNLTEWSVLAICPKQYRFAFVYDLTLRRKNNHGRSAVKRVGQQHKAHGLHMLVASA